MEATPHGWLCGLTVHQVVFWEGSCILLGRCVVIYSPLFALCSTSHFYLFHVSLYICDGEWNESLLHHFFALHVISTQFTCISACFPLAFQHEFTQL